MSYAHLLLLSIFSKCRASRSRAPHETDRRCLQFVGMLRDKTWQDMAPFCSFVSFLVSLVLILLLLDEASKVPTSASTILWT